MGLYPYWGFIQASVDFPRFFPYIGGIVNSGAEQYGIDS
jgi:hypothetical protein